MQIREKEAVKLLPAEDFIINNLSKKQMLELAAKMDCQLRPSAAKLTCAQQLAQLYLYFPNQLHRVLDEAGHACLRQMLAHNCEGPADAPGVETLVRLGIAQILTQGDQTLAVVPKVYVQSAAAMEPRSDG